MKGNKKKKCYFSLGSILIYLPLILQWPAQTLSYCSCCTGICISYTLYTSLPPFQGHVLVDMWGAAKLCAVTAVCYPILPRFPLDLYVCGCFFFHGPEGKSRGDPKLSGGGERLCRIRRALILSRGSLARRLMLFSDTASLAGNHAGTGITTWRPMQISKSKVCSESLFCYWIRDTWWEEDGKWRKTWHGE